MASGRIAARHFRCSDYDRAPCAETPPKDCGLSWTKRSGDLEGDGRIEDYQRCFKLGPKSSAAHPGACCVSDDQFAAIEAKYPEIPLRLRSNAHDGHEFGDRHCLTECPNNDLDQELAKFATDNKVIVVPIPKPINPPAA